MTHQISPRLNSRLEVAKALFEKQFGTRQTYLAVHAPGRSEIAGNHTDHEEVTLLQAHSMSQLTALQRPITPI